MTNWFWIIFVLFLVSLMYRAITHDEYSGEEFGFFWILVGWAIVFWVGTLFYDDSGMKIIEFEKEVSAEKTDIYSIRNPVNMVSGGFMIGISSDMQYVVYIKNTDGSKTLKTIPSEGTRVYDSDDSIGFEKDKTKPYYLKKVVRKIKTCDRNVKDTRWWLSKFLFGQHYCDYYDGERDSKYDKYERKIFVPKGAVRQSFAL